jgi:hypothetical protein
MGNAKSTQRAVIPQVSIPTTNSVTKPSYDELVVAEAKRRIDLEKQRIEVDKHQQIALEEKKRFEEDVAKQIALINRNATRAKLAEEQRIKQETEERNAVEVQNIDNTFRNKYPNITSRDNGYDSVIMSNNHVLQLKVRQILFSGQLLELKVPFDAYHRYACYQYDVKLFNFKHKVGMYILDEQFKVNFEKENGLPVNTIPEGFVDVHNEIAYINKEISQLRDMRYVSRSGRNVSPDIRYKLPRTKSSDGYTTIIPVVHNPKTFNDRASGHNTYSGQAVITWTPKEDVKP